MSPQPEAGYGRIAFCFHSSHGRMTTCCCTWSAFSPSSCSKYVTWPPSARACGLQPRVHVGVDGAIDRDLEVGSRPRRRRGRASRRRICRPASPPTPCPRRHRRSADCSGRRAGGSRTRARRQRGSPPHGTWPNGTLLLANGMTPLRMGMDHGHHVRPRPVDFAMDEALEETLRPCGNGLAVEIVLHDVVGLGQGLAPATGTTRAGRRARGGAR